MLTSECSRIPARASFIHMTLSYEHTIIRLLMLSRHSMPIPPRVAPGAINMPPLLHMMSNNLAPPKHTPLPPRQSLNLMPQFPQPLRHFLRNPFFQMHRHIQLLSQLRCRRARTDAESRRIERG